MCFFFTFIIKVFFFYFHYQIEGKGGERRGGEGKEEKGKEEQKSDILKSVLGILKKRLFISNVLVMVKIQE